MRSIVPTAVGAQLSTKKYTHVAMLANSAACVAKKTKQYLHFGKLNRLRRKCFRLQVILSNR
jgi:hypothetical protein